MKKTCIECGKEINKNVKVCPNCGCPFEKANKELNIKFKFLNTKIISLVSLISIIILIVFSFINYKTEPHLFIYFLFPFFISINILKENNKILTNNKVLSNVVTTLLAILVGYLLYFQLKNLIAYIDLLKFPYLNIILTFIKRLSISLSLISIIILIVNMIDNNMINISKRVISVVYLVCLISILIYYISTMVILCMFFYMLNFIIYTVFFIFLISFSTYIYLLGRKEV